MAHTSGMPRVTVILDPEQLAELDEEAGALGVSRSEALRRHLDLAEPLPVPEPTLPTREGTLLKLEQAAQGGSVVAMATLARELRLGAAEPVASPAAVEEARRVDDLAALRLVHADAEQARR